MHDEEAVREIDDVVGPHRPRRVRTRLIPRPRSARKRLENRHIPRPGCRSTLTRDNKTKNEECNFDDGSAHEKKTTAMRACSQCERCTRGGPISSSRIRRAHRWSFTT